MAQSFPLYGNSDSRRTPAAAQWQNTTSAPTAGVATGVRVSKSSPVADASGSDLPKVDIDADKASQAAALAALAEEVRRAQSGDTKAMSELIENNRTWVRGIAYAVLGDAHLAEDAAQDVCVRMVKHLRGLDTPEAFRPWVYRMTRNVALSMAQRRDRAPQPLGLDAEQMVGGIQIAKDEPPGAALEAEERVNVVLETISRLPHIYREVLVLKHVQDLSYAEMSAILGVNIKSLEVRLVRARKLLQVRLGRRFERRRKRDPGRGGFGSERRASG
jgi:RNA polymerase sigma-70 factor (ECF subfamily)